MCKRALFQLICFLVCGACTASALGAQVPVQQQRTGVVTGVIRDEQGGAIREASVEVACGGEGRSMEADAVGNFVMSSLPFARCSVSAESRLFERATVEADLTSGAAHTTLTLLVKGFATQVVVTPTRGREEATFDLPEVISVTTREAIDSRPFRLLPQVLREEPGVLLQQTTTAQASPIIRGFTGQSNVLLLDGVRFNTASWRSGPSQYFSWIDSGVVSRLELVRGPGSVQYGSDALGGTINVRTMTPTLSPQGLRVGGDVRATLGSADKSSGGQVNLVVQAPTAAFRFGATTERVGNLRAGRGIDSHAAVTRFLGLPSTVLGTRLADSGFKQSGAYVVGQVRAGALGSVRTLYLHENQTGASRYDRINGGDGVYRSGFTPQRLDFSIVRYESHRAGIFDEWSAGLSVNRQVDGRFEQTRPTAVFDQQRAVTTVLGYQFDVRRQIGRHRLLAGTEFYDESTDASREQITPLTGAVAPNRPDIPDGTGYVNLGVFVQDTAELLPGRVTLRWGLRYGRFGFSTTANPAFGVVDERVLSDAVTFSAGTVIALSRNLHATFNVGRGFRAANSADLGNTGLTGGGGLEVAPSRASALGGFVGTTGATGAVSTGEVVPHLRPEVLYSFEPGLKFRAGRFSASVSAYDLEYLKSIQRRAIVFPTDVVGALISGYQVVRQDATGLAYIAQDIRPIATRVNVDHARLLGFDAEGITQIGRQWRASAFISMTNGSLLNTHEYLRRMPPPLGGAAVRWSSSRTWIEGLVSFAASQTRFNSGDLTDARIGAVRTRSSIANHFNGSATDLGLVTGGLLQATGETLAQVQDRVLGAAASSTMYDHGPGFFVLGARGGVRLTPQVEMTVIGENLTDRNYRLYGSGVDAAGINLQVQVRYRF